MKKKIMLILVFIIGLFMFNVNVKAKVDYGQCITKYGSMNITSMGSNHSTLKGGSVSFTGRNLKWSSSPVNITVDIRAQKDYKLTNIYYVIGNCSDEITGLDGKSSSYKISVHVDKGYVQKLSVWGTMVNTKVLATQKNGQEVSQRLKVGTKRKSVSVKFYNKSKPAATTKGSGGATVEKAKCDLFKDILNKYWTWVMVIMPILTILLISFDTLKVIISSDPDGGGGKDGNSMTLPKVASNAIKRMTALIVLMLLPYLIDIIFGWFGLSKYWCFK